MNENGERKLSFTFDLKRKVLIWQIFDFLNDSEESRLKVLSLKVELEKLFADLQVLVHRVHRLWNGDRLALGHGPQNFQSPEKSIGTFVHDVMQIGERG